MYHDDDDDCDLLAFKARYHQRSVTEVVFGAIKKMYGGHVRCRRPTTNNARFPMRIICYNIELITRSHMESSRITRQLLEAITA